MSREVGGRAVGTCKGPRDQDGETVSTAARVFLVRRGMGLGWRCFLASVDGFERVIGDWELGMDDLGSPTRSPEHPENGQRPAASSVSNRGQALDLGGEGAGHPMGRAGQRGFNAMAVDEPGNATTKKTSTRKSHAFPANSPQPQPRQKHAFAIPCVIFVLAHLGWYHRASAP